MRLASLSPFFARQDGLVTRDQALGHGVSPSALKRGVAAGQLAILLPRVYATAAAPRTWRQLARAASLWAGRPCAVSHRSAAWMLGLLDQAPVAVDLSVPRARRLRSSTSVRVHPVTALPDRALRFLANGPVTAAARTMIDSMSTTASPRDREVEAAKAIERSRQRFPRD